MYINTVYVRNFNAYVKRYRIYLEEMNGVSTYAIKVIF